MARRYPKHKPYNHYDGYNEVPAKVKDFEKIDSFKDFDYKGYDVKKGKKVDSQLKKVWDKIVKASSSQDLKLAAGLLLGVLIILDKDRKLIGILKDIVNGRVGFDTLEDFRDAIKGIFGKVAEEAGSSRRRR